MRARRRKVHTEATFDDSNVPRTGFLHLHGIGDNQTPIHANHESLLSDRFADRIDQALISDVDAVLIGYQDHQI